MSNVVQSISTGLSTVDYVQSKDCNRGELLEKELTTICNSLGVLSDITEGNADVEFLLNIVAAYIISKKNDKLSEEDKEPSVLFNERLFPMIDNIVEEEDILDGSNADNKVS